MGKTANYETMYIMKPGLEEDDYSALVEKYKGIIESNEGEVIEINRMGLRKLAYEINDYREGYYVVVKYAGSGNTVDELKRIFRLTDEVIRYLVVKEE